MSLRDSLSAYLAAAPDRPSIEVQGVWRTKRDVHAVATGLEALLVNGGVPCNHGVGLIARNRLGHIASLAALIANGRPVVMLHAYQTPSALAREIKDLKLSAVVGDDEDWAHKVLADAAREAGALAIRVTHEEGRAAADLLAGTPLASTAVGRIPPASTAIEMLTSGTTGPPKRIPIRIDTIDEMVADARVTANRKGGADDGTVAAHLHFFPFGNISGLYMLLVALAEDQPLVLMERFSVPEWERVVRTYRPQFASLPPAGLRMILDAEVPPDALASLEAIRVGSGPIDPKLWARWDKLYGVPILNMYGATEFCGVVSSWTLEDYRRYADGQKRGSAGRVRPGMQLRIVDGATGKTLPTGEEGLITVLAPRVSNEWMRTSDTGWLDSDGFLYVSGRTDSVIIRGGFKIWPETVSRVLRSHPAILDCEIIGFPDERLGAVPVAAYERRDGYAPVTEQELATMLRAELPAPFIPVRFVAFERLPRTATLKVDLGALRPRLKAAIGQA